jgi:hypothetical protein
MQAKFLQRLDNAVHIALHGLSRRTAQWILRRWRNRRWAAKKRR